MLENKNKKREYTSFNKENKKREERNTHLFFPMYEGNFFIGKKRVSEKEFRDAFNKGISSLK